MKRPFAFIICSCAVGSIFRKKQIMLTTVPSQQHVTVGSRTKRLWLRKKKRTGFQPTQGERWFQGGSTLPCTQVSSLKISGITIDDAEQLQRSVMPERCSCSSTSGSISFSLRCHTPSAGAKLSSIDWVSTARMWNRNMLTCGLPFTALTCRCTTVTVSWKKDLQYVGLAGPKLKYIRTRKTILSLELPAARCGRRIAQV